MIRTSGRSVRLTRTTKPVASAAWQRMATSRQKPHGRRAPQRGCGVEAGNLQPLAKDDACTQKADPGDNLGGYPRGLPSSANKPSNITNLASPIAPSLFFRKPSIL